MRTDTVAHQTLPLLEPDQQGLSLKELQLAKAASYAKMSDEEKKKLLDDSRKQFEDSLPESSFSGEGP